MFSDVNIHSFHWGIIAPSCARVLWEPEVVSWESGMPKCGHGLQARCQLVLSWRRGSRMHSHWVTRGRRTDHLAWCLVAVGWITSMPTQLVYVENTARWNAQLLLITSRQTLRCLMITVWSCPVKKVHMYFQIESWDHYCGHNCRKHSVSNMATASSLVAVQSKRNANR